MITPATTEILKNAYQGGYLRAAFIDCQKAEFLCIEDKTPFTVARDFAIVLRRQEVPISHFLFDQSKPESLKPFLYKGAQKHIFPNREMNFEAVIPARSEMIYPKEGFNGFENPHSEAILSTADPQQRSVLICAGFTARACLMETAIGSFEKATNPDNHHVIIALDATNLHPDGYQEYIVDFLAKADESIRERIGFATVDKIINATAQPKATP